MENVSTKKENPDSLHSQPCVQNHTRLKSTTKRAAVLRLLIQRGELGLNCFDAVRLIHDYVLRSTVSDLQLLYGLRFSRKWERVPGYNGSSVDCMRYWLDDKGRAQAAALLGEESPSIAEAA